MVTQVLYSGAEKSGAECEISAEGGDCRGVEAAQGLGGGQPQPHLRPLVNLQRRGGALETRE